MYVNGPSLLQGSSWFFDRIDAIHIICILYFCYISVFLHFVCIV